MWGLRGGTAGGSGGRALWERGRFGGPQSAAVRMDGTGHRTRIRRAAEDRRQAAGEDTEEAQAGGDSVERGRNQRSNGCWMRVAGDRVAAWGWGRPGDGEAWSQQLSRRRVRGGQEAHATPTVVPWVWWYFWAFVPLPHLEIHSMGALNGPESSVRPHPWVLCLGPYLEQRSLRMGLLSGSSDLATSSSWVSPPALDAAPGVFMREG